MSIRTHKTGMPATVVAPLSCVLLLLWGGSIKELVIVPLLLTLGWKLQNCSLDFLLMAGSYYLWLTMLVCLSSLKLVQLKIKSLQICLADSYFE